MSGALVKTVDGALFDHLLLPRQEDRIDVRAVLSWFENSDVQPDLFIGEDVLGIPNETAISTWMLSRAEASVMALVDVLGYKTHMVTPLRWRKAVLQGYPLGARAQIKSSSVSWASEKHPGLCDALRLKKNDGLADAACIAEYGLRLLKRGKV